MYRVTKLIIVLLYVSLIAWIVQSVNTGNLPVVLHWIHAFPGGDKICHVLLVGGLAFFVNWGLDCHRIRILGRHVLLGTAACLLIASVEEISQHWNPLRSFDLLDFAMNIFGILTIGALAQWMPRTRVAGSESARKTPAAT